MPAAEAGKRQAYAWRSLVAFSQKDNTHPGERTTDKPRTRAESNSPAPSAPTTRMCDPACGLEIHLHSPVQFRDNSHECNSKH